MQLTKEEFTKELTRVFTLNGLDSLLTPDATEKFYLLTLRMLEENEKYNLTAIKEPHKIILHHYADCAAAASFFKSGAKIIDVGCGAGFPSLPLAILRPDLKITAMDSTAKRVNYVTETARLLSLDGICGLIGRAEELARDSSLRESFDYATARAVAELRVLCELCIPFVKCGGEMIAMKGRSAYDELDGARGAIGKLGGGEPRISNVTLTNGNDEPLSHPIITIKKKKPTSVEFPRQYSKISKKPL